MPRFNTSEIEKFAEWFHQDFGIIMGDTEVAAESYLQSLSQNQRNILADEVSTLLTKYPGKDYNGLKKAWLRLGAQWWHQSLVPSILIELSKNKL